MAKDQKILLNISKCAGGFVNCAGDARLPIPDIETVKIGECIVDDVRFVPDLKFNPLSTNQLLDKGCKAEKDGEKCTIYKDSRILLSAQKCKSDGSLFTIGKTGRINVDWSSCLFATSHQITPSGEIGTPTSQ